MGSAHARRRCEVRPTALGMGVFAVELIRSGEEVLELPPVFDDEPGRHTIQVDEHRHQAYTGDVDDFVNHACDPNAYLDAGSLRLLARRSIVAGEEITLDYATFEWDMVDPFVCGCDGTPRTIRGFRYLSTADRLRVADIVPAWLSARLLA
jgi:SET domain-containing protein